MCLSYLAEPCSPRPADSRLRLWLGNSCHRGRAASATAVGVDHDDQVVLATTENARFNAVDSDQLQVFNLQDWQRLTESDLVPFDVVAANILAGPLQQLAEHFCALVAAQSRSCCRILPQQVDSVVAAHPLIDFVKPVIEDDWACLIGIKNS